MGNLRFGLVRKWIDAVRVMDNLLVETTMSTLPPEILDSILDHLHDEPATLKTCCVVSKSWVPRTRRHLFTHVRFGIPDPPIELWKKAFPDPSNSPAHHTRTLSIFGNSVIVAADTGKSGWIRTFHNVIRLELFHVDQATLFTLYGLSPTLRSLSLELTPFDFGLIYSFPLLEDLVLADASGLNDVDRWNAILPSPKLTGRLDLEACRWIHSTTRRLLSLSCGLHFSEIKVMFCDEEVESVSNLVSMCSKTLENLTLFYWYPSAFPSIPMVAKISQSL